MNGLLTIQYKIRRPLVHTQKSGGAGHHIATISQYSHLRYVRTETPLYLVGQLIGEESYRETYLNIRIFAGIMISKDTMLPQRIPQ